MTLPRFFQRTEWGLLLAIVVVVLLAGGLDAQHNYFKNPRPSAVDVLRQTALLGVFTLGVAVVIIAGGIDLSAGSVIAFSGTICATLLLLLAPEEMGQKITWYRIDAEALKKLEKGGLSADLLAKLQPLSGQTFTNEEELRARLAEVLTREEGERYADRLVGSTGFPKPLGLGVLAVAIAGTLAVGFLIGSLHAWLITVVGLPPFVATLATLVGLRSLGRVVVEGVTAATPGFGKSTQIQVYDTQFRYLATSVWIPVALFLTLAFLMWVLMSRTVVGRHLHALGGNENAARLSGIQTDRLKWLAYCLSAVLASVAGILYIGEESVADPQRQGRGYELNAIAAAVVGGCSLQGGVGTIPGAVLGALFLRTVIDGVAKVIKTGADVYEGLIVGVVVVVAVAFTHLREAGKRGKYFFRGALGLVTILNLTLLAGGLAALVAPQMVDPQTGLRPLTAAGVAAALTLGLLLLVRLLEGRDQVDKTQPVP